MIDKQSLTSDWILLKKKEYKGSDPSILERTVFALYLVEQLSLTGLDFTFKGGTSLLLLLEDSNRFSIDVDIVLPNDYSSSVLEGKLAKIIPPDIFIRFELDEKRSHRDGVPKAHYKFIYNSRIAQKEQEILLDILFEECHYPVLLKKPIQTPWILEDGSPVEVTMPDINSILGDKLTAYAPNTTGIPYRKQKEREIIKQLFDVANLFDAMDNFESVRISFENFAFSEIGYHTSNEITVKEVLHDIIDTSLILAKRDDKGDVDKTAAFKELQTGINQFQYFLFSGNFRIEHAQTAGSKAAYLAAMILTGYNGKIDRNPTTNVPVPAMIENPEFNILNKKLKFVPGGALFYWNQTINLLTSS